MSDGNAMETNGTYTTGNLNHKSYSNLSLSKQAVYIINATGICAHPIHHHSFIAVGSSSIFAPAAGFSLLSTPKCFFVGTFHKCVACHNRLGSRPQISNSGSHFHEESSSGMEMLHCIACGVYAHRSCAFASSAIDMAESSVGMPGCKVNRPIVEAALGLKRKQEVILQATDANLTASCNARSPWPFFGRKTDDEDKSKVDSNNQTDLNDQSGAPNNDITCNHQVSPKPPNSKSAIKETTSFEEHRIPLKDAQHSCDTAPHEPPHKNLYTILKQQHSTNDKLSWNFFGRRHGVNIGEEDDVHIATDDPVPLNKIVNQPSGKTDELSSKNGYPQTWCPHTTVSKSESSMPWFTFGQKATNDKTGTGTVTGDHSDHITDNCISKYDDVKTDAPNQNIDSHYSAEASLVHKELSHSALKDVQTSDNDMDEQTKTIDQPPHGAFRASIEIIRKTTQTSANISKACSIGMVAGGVAGLAIAGPAGVIVGSQIGKTVLTVGAAVEGATSIGVLTMGLVAASKYSHKSKDQRQLELPGHETCSLVLIRPDVEVDPIWTVYAHEARKSWEKMNHGSLKSSWGSGFGSLFSHHSNEQAAEIRYRRDVDIISADGSELAMREKVFLLVNRTLNDKMSLPGYVYRYLIRKCIVRGSTIGDYEHIDTTSTPCSSSRSYKQDAHGVIKHVTAALLEVRESLASSPILTEMSASAVEMLIFGELYDGVFEEIVQETMEQRKKFLSKIEAQSKQRTSEKSFLSISAVEQLKRIPKAHTPGDKLFYAVNFLECVSVQFSTIFQNKCIDADVLLTTVCQHIVVASGVNLYAEVAFIEEFSRDEQLLRGKEGYALITLQASLHHLDAIDSLDSIFMD